MRFFILAALLAVISPYVHAAPPLAVISTAGAKAGDRVDAGTSTASKYDRPLDTDLVRVGTGWGNFVWLPFGGLAPSDTIDACMTNIADGYVAPLPWAALTDQCKSWTAAPKSACAVDSFAASVPDGAEPLGVVLTWNVAGVQACVASGAWTGARAASGTHSIAGLPAPASYTLTCSAPPAAPGSALLRWEPPTQNTDGSALANLAGHRIQYGTDAARLTQLIEVPNAIAMPASDSATDKQFTVVGLAAGNTWYFTMTAYSAGGNESTRTGMASKSIPLAAVKTWTKTIDVAAPGVPNPPRLLLVLQATAYRLSLAANKLSAVAVGTVPLKSPCDATQPALDMYRVDNASVVLKPGLARPKVTFAKCG